MLAAPVNAVQSAPHAGNDSSTERREHPTIWGLSPVQLHDHFWAARGVSVVRLGEVRDLPVDAEIFLLTDARTLAVFRLAPVLETLSWVRPAVMFLRVVARQDGGYRERVVTDAGGEFVRFQRLYGGTAPRLSRVALTRDRRLAYAWQQSTDARLAWKRLRRDLRDECIEVATVNGRIFDRDRDEEVSAMVNTLVASWRQPSSTVGNTVKHAPDVWIYDSSKVENDVCFVGPAWVGAGRKIAAGETVLGPAVLWDDPASRPQPEEVDWSELEPAVVLATVRQRAAGNRASGPVGKRLFDVCFAACVLLLTLPLYPLVMLAIWLEDGRPFFFSHQRETLGGREFGCIKFRSMRKDAEKVKAELAKANQADGPQFYMRDDPRLTRVGRFIRRTNIDELPQFINVLLGDMSVVGPRPSPRSENQFSPGWREARLSVRAGITGLWQVRRTRRPGQDFQEWIKYDLEYVNTMGWRTDLGILFRTARVLVRG